MNVLDVCNLLANLRFWTHHIDNTGISLGAACLTARLPG